MKKTLLSALIIMLLTPPATALSAPTGKDLVMPDYYLGHAIASVLLLAGKLGYTQYKSVQDAALSQRLTQAKKLILTHPAHRYRFSDFNIVIIQGREGEPNAFSLGPTIFVTQSLGSALNDRQLTAVLAHEIGHSQVAHFLQRIPMPLGALVNETASLLKADKPRPDSLKKFVEMIQADLETVNLATEMQADCLAAVQLEKLYYNGYANKPMDLVDATSALYGFDVTTAKDDFGDPGIIRAKIIQSQSYKITGCGIFTRK